MTNPYPFSPGYLQMQKRRRENPIAQIDPMGKNLISSKDMKQSLYFSGANQLRKEPVLRRFKDNHEIFFDPPIIWGLVNLVNSYLLSS